MESMNKWTPGPWRTGDRFQTIFGPPNGNPVPTVIAAVENDAQIHPTEVFR